MNTAEDKIRAALRETAEQIPSRSVPPLRLPEPARRRLLPRRPHGRHLPAWLPPLGVAAAVAAVVIGSLTAAHVIGGSAGPAGRHRMTRVPTPARVDGLPPYFIRAVGPARTTVRQARISGRMRRIPASYGSRLAVYSTATGRPVATVTIPGREIGLAAGGGAGTFFAAGQFLCEGPDRGSVPCRGASRARPAVTLFYRITLTAAGARVKPLPIRPMPGLALTFSATADGRRLAVYRTMATGGQPGGAALTVASTATGQERNWTTTRPGPLPGVFLLSWLADGRRVAFLWMLPGRNLHTVVHLLDTGVPGTDLLAGVSLVPPQLPAFVQAISPDASTVIATTPGRPRVAGRGVPGWSVISSPARTGRPVRVLLAAGRHQHGTYWNCQPLWVSHTGQRVLIRCGYHPASGGSQHRVFLAGPGRALRRLPWLEPPTDAFTLGSMPQG